MRMGCFRHEFDFGFKLQRGLLRLGQPGFAQRLQAREIIRRDGVGGEQRRVERQARPRVGVEFAAFKQSLRALKRREGRACLRTDRAINRARRNRPPRQRDLRLQHGADRPGKFNGGHRRWSG